MIVFLTLIYVGILYALIKAGKVPDTKGTWMTLIPYELILLIGFFIPMQWGAPSGEGVVMAYSVGITPNVTGMVTEVPIEPNEPLKKGDVLFRIDPTQYQAALDGLQAQLRLAELRLEQSQALAEQDAGSIYEVQSYEAQVDSLKAQIENAQWNLDETVVRAPADGFATNITLRPGVRVANLPLFRAIAFIDTSEKAVLTQIHQIYSRYIEPGQTVEIAFKSLPGRVYSGKVRYLIPATAQGQAPLTGYAFQPVANVMPGPFAVFIDVDDPEVTEMLVPGTVASVAIYTEKVSAAHVIRKVMLRMDAIMNYFKPA
jgi:RND family efflux transporter MFP subunit